MLIDVFVLVNSGLPSNLFMRLGFFWVAIVRDVGACFGRPGVWHSCVFVFLCRFIVSSGEFMSSVCLTCLSVDGRGRNFGLGVLPSFILSLSCCILRIVVVLASSWDGSHV